MRNNNRASLRFVVFVRPEVRILLRRILAQHDLSNNLDHVQTNLLQHLISRHPHCVGTNQREERAIQRHRCVVHGVFAAGAAEGKSLNEVWALWHTYCLLSYSLQLHYFDTARFHAPPPRNTSCLGVCLREAGFVIHECMSRALQRREGGSVRVPFGEGGFCLESASERADFVGSVL